MKTIGLLHSSVFTTGMKAKVRAGLAAANWPSGKYNFIEVADLQCRYGKKANTGQHDELETTVRTFRNHNPPADLIIAAGGLVCPVAAQHVLSTGRKIDVACLIGRTPQTNADAGFAELHDATIIKAIEDLSATTGNAQRLDALVAAHVPANGIALLVNTNSAMHEAEIREWIALGQTNVIRFPDDMGKKDNDHAHFDGAFGFAKAKTLSGIVVSGDPFFFRFRTRLMKAANSKGVKLCFPFAEYEFSNGVQIPEFRSGGHMIVGPALLNAYESLGRKAGAVLTAQPAVKS